MYSYEIKEYIDNRGGKLTREEALFIMDMDIHSQLNHIKFQNDEYQMWDKDGNFFNFKIKS